MCIAPHSVLCLLLAAATTLRGETNTPVRALGGGMFQVGLVRLESKARTVTFPAAVNLREETIEYAVVHKIGKTHESLFRTDARPQDIHVAMLLLGARPMMTNLFGANGKAAPLGDTVFLAVSWTNDTARSSHAVEDLVLNRETNKPMTRGAWIYNGSNFSEDAFTAQRDGSIISIHIDPDALINNPRPGRENDDLYAPNTAELPPIGTPVEITIRLTTAK
jgi:hypothetical protein